MNVPAQPGTPITSRLSLVFFFAAFALASCSHSSQQAPPESPHVTFIGWGPATLRELSSDQFVLDKFTKETGIHVDFIAGPESMTDRLQLYHQYLQSKSPIPDVYYMDVVWPAVLADDMMDLTPYLAEQAREHADTLVKNGTVRGKFVSMPFNVELGLLYYRTDLLKKYGYAQPPATWAELQKMAARIQAGERSAGNQNFWGYVWQGAPYEGLTCNALEWQASEGGGSILDSDAHPTFNNPRTIAAMKRARSWVGSISPPSVTAFREQDSRNMFNAGNAAFARDWIWRQYHLPSANPALREKVAVTLLPAGAAARASTLGGQALAISTYSVHPKEAAALIRFLTRRDIQLQLWNLHAMLPSLREFQDDPKYRQSKPEIAGLWDQLQNIVVARPSTPAGQSYDQLSHAYFTAVHSILTGDVSAEKGISDLERRVTEITDFPHSSAPQ